MRVNDYPQEWRAFTHWKRAWYAMVRDGRFVDEVMFGFYPAEGGTTGEMAMRWIDLGGETSPKLEAFNDSWAALAAIPELIPALGKISGQRISPEQFCGLLLDLGFRDRTPTKGPDGIELHKVKQDALAKLTPQERAALGLKS